MSETPVKTPAKNKNPIVAVIASFLIPGLGQIYNGEVRKGIGFLIIAIIFALIWLSLLQMQQPHMTGAVLAAGGAYVLLWIGSMYDAYKAAKKINS